MGRHQKSSPKESALFGVSSFADSLSRVKSVLQALRDDIQQGEITLRAASLSYTSLLSIVPLLAISFSVLKGLGVHNQLEPFLLGMLTSLGPQGNDIAREIVTFVENIKVGVLGSVGLIFLFYIVLSGVQKIEYAFNFLWQVREIRPFFRRFSDYLSVILVGPVLIFGSFGLSTAFWENSKLEVVSSSLAVPFLGWIGEYILLVMVFTFLYILIPNTKVGFFSALIGALSAACIWQGVKWVFSTFILSSAQYSTIYAVFAAPIIFMIWLFFGWMAILLGVRIAFYHQNPSAIRTLREQIFKTGICQIERVGLDMMARIGHRFSHGGGATKEEELRAVYPHLQGGIRPLLDGLINGGFLIRSEGKSLCVLPARPLEMMPVFEVLTALRGPYDPADTPARSSLANSQTIEDIFQRFEAASQRNLRGLTIKTLIENKSIQSPSA